MDMYVAHTRAHIQRTCHMQSPCGMPRGDFSCKFAYKIDVNFYKTIIATIYVTIILTKLRMPGRYAEFLLTVSGNVEKVNALFLPRSVHNPSARIIGKDNRQFNCHMYLLKKNYASATRRTVSTRLFQPFIWPELTVCYHLCQIGMYYTWQIYAQLLRMYVYTNVDECAYARLRRPSSRFAFVHRQRL